MAVKKSIAIIGEGETEWWYFETLRVACRYKFKVAPDFPQHSDIPHMAKLAEDYVKRETDYVVCLVDMDRLLRMISRTVILPWLSGPSSSVVHFVCLACAFGSRLVSQKAAMWRASSLT